MKLNNTNTNTKETKHTLIITSAIIAAITLAMIAATVVVIASTMPIVQTAHASCISSPKGDVACSDGAPPPLGVIGASTFSRSHGQGDKFGNAASGPSGSLSQSFTFPPRPSHQSSSHNFEGQGNCADTTCSGNK